MTRVAFIGLGEAGGILAAGLAEAGATVTTAFDILIHDSKKSDALIAKANRIGIAAVASAAEVAVDVDVVVAAVVADQTVVAAQSVAAHLKPGQFYLDINSTSPRHKQEAARAVEASGAAYVEAAVMNVVPGPGIKVPMLLAGEKAAELAALLTPFGMNLDPIGSEIGTASAVKMVRSIFVKGFNCILLECMVAASRFKVEERILDSLGGSYPEFDWRALASDHLPRLIRHAKRQSAEMEAVAETLEEVDLEPLMAMASAKRLKWLADFGLRDQLGKLPEDYVHFLKLMDDVSSEGVA